MNFAQIIQVGTAVLGAILNAGASLIVGKAFELPKIRTYIGNQHVELDVTIKRLS